MSAVDEVKARIDIVDVVGEHCRLQKAGRYFKALCPFHTEKTPSFIVYPDRQSWHCFGGCATGGDVIAFVQRKENLDFAGALRLLADRAGIELRNDGPRREQMRTLQDANEAAAVYFHGMLQSNAAAHAYIDERGLDRGAIADFLIGYAPAGWSNLRDHLVARGYSEAQLVEAGLLVERDTSAGSGQSGTYDRFRDRIIFPIRDERGRVVGFGGRVMPGPEANRNDGSAKYINTPQTPMFDKGGLLYGLDRARDDIRQSTTAVIVEGYMDVIAAHQQGYRNVVASMGTSLTDRQAGLLQRFAERVVLAMDADEAGSAANLRAIQVVAAATEASRSPNGGSRVKGPLDIRVLALPVGKDPDELIRQDASAWPAAVASAKPVVDHLIAVVSAGIDLTQPRDRAELVAEVLPAVGTITDPVLQAHYLQRLSRLARVSEEALRRELPRRTAGRRREATSPEAVTPKPVVAKRAPGEEYCLALLYREPSLAEKSSGLRDDLFSLSENRELFRRWRAGQAVTEEDEGLWEQHQQVQQTRILTTETAQLEVAFLDCVDRLEQVRMRAVKEASALALAEGEAGVRPGQVASIAHAKMAADRPGEDTDDGAAEMAASQLVEDMENGLRLFRPAIERSRSEQTGHPAD